MKTNLARCVYVIVGIAAAQAWGAPRARAQDTVVAPAALATCTPLTLIHTREIPPGTGIAVSPDGHWLAEYIHTLTGGEVRLRARQESSAGSPMGLEPGSWTPEPQHTIPLAPPELLKGIQWRIIEARFSADSRVLAVRTTGAIFLVDAVRGAITSAIGVDPEKKTYPGQMAFGGSTLAVSFWPAQSIFAQNNARERVEIRLLDTATGKWLRSLLLPLGWRNEWTKIALTADASRLAVLLRPEVWPGKSRLIVFDTMTAKSNGELKIAAEDVKWAPDGKQLLLLGSKLVWLDGDSGKPAREAQGDAGASENNVLRLNSDADVAAGHFERFSSVKRLLRRNDQLDSMVTLWQLASGRMVCSVPLQPETSVSLWPTARREMVALEETYDLADPQKRKLKNARVVTYRLADGAKP